MSTLSTLTPSRRRGKNLSDYDPALFIPGLSLTRVGVNAGGQLDVARCPLCSAPLVARVRRTGPYFHCLCAEAPRLAS